MKNYFIKNQETGKITKFTTKQEFLTFLEGKRRSLNKFSISTDNCKSWYDAKSQVDDKPQEVEIVSPESETITEFLETTKTLVKLMESNSSSELKSNETTKFRFSFGGMLATALFAFIAQKLIQLNKVLNEIEHAYENSYLSIILNYIKEQGNKDIARGERFYNNLKIFLVVLIIGYILKTLVAIRHTLFTKKDNGDLLGFIMLIEILWFAISFGITPFNDFIKIFAILAIPGVIGYFLMYLRLTDR